MENLNFEKQELGNFNFFQHDADGKSFTGKFIGILNDTVKNPNLPEYEGSPRTLKYKREDIQGIVFESLEDKQVYILGNYYQVAQFMRNEIANKSDFDNTAYKVVRLKKAGDKQTDFVSFEIFKAILKAETKTETVTETKTETETETDGATFTEKRKKK